MRRISPALEHNRRTQRHPSEALWLRPGLQGAALVEPARSSRSSARSPGLALHPPHGLPELNVAAQGALVPEVGVALDRREWGAQLVGGVGDEAPQPVLGCLFL